jgi:uncharacterized membrane protein
MFASRNASLLLFLMSGILVVALVVAVLGWNKAKTAQQRVTAVEVQLEAERVGKNIADVTTCFNRAYGRPALSAVLRTIAGVTIDSTDRTIINRAIEKYNRDTPTVDACRALAVERNIDPTPYINNPPTEAGNGGEENR